VSSRSKADSKGSILIVGGGPAGLGAAWRLHELGYTDWQLREKADRFGGLAGSYVDPRGFTWDLGGHVVFSHYRYFDNVLDTAVGRDWVEHVREAWIWMRGRFIPYPLQNNIRHLPPAEVLDCLEGLLAAGEADAATLSNFAEWIERRFGAGLARAFMMPYNRKVWACEPAEMNAGWVGERVAPVDFKRVLRNVVLQRDDLGWGPNATFRFPLAGGTGRIWSAIAERLPAGQVRLGSPVEQVESHAKTARCAGGEDLSYDWLITTVPLDVLLRCIRDVPDLQGCSQQFRHSGTHVVGVGLQGRVPEALATKCWIYFPEPELPFYRVTVFSNYSPNNVPEPGRQWSLIAEVSESPDKPTDADRVAERCLAGLRTTELIPSDATIESVWHTHVDHGYPTPFLGRDALLERIEPVLRSRNILSRGRFGAWKYEVGNMDHSFMQGVEAVNHILLGQEETTLRFPSVVNDLSRHT
jgi:protoporphyrinogen oxidase